MSFRNSKQRTWFKPTLCEFNACSSLFGSTTPTRATTARAENPLHFPRIGPDDAIPICKPGTKAGKKIPKFRNRNKHKGLAQGHSPRSRRLRARWRTSSPLTGKIMPHGAKNSPQLEQFESLAEMGARFRKRELWMSQFPDGRRITV
jgi:hypothetical protein